MSQSLTPAELRLADVIRMSDAPFSDLTVTQIKDGLVHVFRPYVSTSDFAYTGGVIPYIGIETFTLFISDTRPVTVIQRK